MLKLRGVLCPLATPFNHRGELYSTKIRHNIGRLELTKVSGFIVGSTWGEGPLLSDAELLKLWEEVKAASKGERVLIAAAGAEGVAPSLVRCRAAQRAGYQAAWIAPHLAYASESGLQMLRFRAIADGSPLPVIVGELDGSLLSAADAAALALHPNVAAICSAASPLEHLAGLIGSNDCTPMTSQIAGLSEALAGGMQAAASPLANCLPFHLLSIEEAVRTREVDAARDLENRLQPIDEVLARRGVAGLKHAMDLRGYFGGSPRLPLRPLDAGGKAEVESALEGLVS